MGGDVSGVVRSRHEVRTRSLVVVGASLVVVGLAAFVTLVVLNAIMPPAVAPEDTVIETDLGGNATGYQPGGVGFAPVLVPLGLCCVAAGAVALIQVVRHGPRPYLEVHDRGLAWGSRRAANRRTWDQVRWLDLPDNRPIPDHLWARLGLQSRCTVVFDEGKRLTFASNTAEHATLVRALRKHCTGAKRLPVKERTTYRYRHAWLGGALAASAGMAILFWYVSNRPPEVSAAETNTLVSIGVLLAIAAVVGFAGYLTAGQRGS